MYSTEFRAKTNGTGDFARLLSLNLSVMNRKIVNKNYQYHIVPSTILIKGSVYLEKGSHMKRIVTVRQFKSRAVLWKTQRTNTDNFRTLPNMIQRAH